jgi:hypothetical protein
LSPSHYHSTRTWCYCHPRNYLPFHLSITDDNVKFMTAADVRPRQSDAPASQTVDAMPIKLCHSWNTPKHEIALRKPLLRNNGPNLVMWATWASGDVLPGSWNIQCFLLHSSMALIYRRTTHIANQMKLGFPEEQGTFLSSTNCSSMLFEIRPFVTSRTSLTYALIYCTRKYDFLRLIVKSIIYQVTIKLRGLSPRTNYTGRATAAFRRS